MLLDRLDENLDAGNLHLPQPDGQRRALFAADAARAAVGDVAGGVERAKVAAGRHVVGRQLEADAGRLQAPRGRCDIRADRSRTAPGAPARCRA